MKRKPTHPFSRGHIKKIWRDLVEHFGTCSNCRPVDPDNPTAQEKEALAFCPYCDNGEVFTPTGIGQAGGCMKCGGESYQVFRSDGYNFPTPMANARQECINCRIQTHFDFCRTVDENGDLQPCPHGWPDGTAGGWPPTE